MLIACRNKLLDGVLKHRAHRPRSRFRAPGIKPQALAMPRRRTDTPEPGAGGLPAALCLFGKMHTHPAEAPGRGV